MADLIHAGLGAVVAETSRGAYVGVTATGLADLQFAPLQSARIPLSQLETPLTTTGLSTTAVGLSLTRQVGAPVTVDRLAFVFSPTLARPMLDAARLAPKDGKVIGCITQNLGFAIASETSACM
jgi:hypothetical protein